jgi:Putative transposase
VPSIVTAYEKRIRELEQRKIVLAERIANCGRPLRDFDESLRTSLDFLRNPWNLWNSERLESKRAVLKLAFAGRLAYTRNDGFGTPDRVGIGPRAGQKVFTLHTGPAQTHEESRKGVAQHAGFSLHAGIGIEAHARTKLERLARYVSRPAVSVERLTLATHGDVRYQLKTPSWAQRLKRVFAIDIERCRRCGGRLKVLASIERPALIEQS